MKKRICLAVSAALISSCCIGYSVFSLEKPNIFVNGNQIETDAFIQDGVTYVPLRAVSESLGADVAWNEETQEINISQSQSGADIYSYAINKISPSTVAIVGNYTGNTTATYQDKYAEGIAHGTGVVITSGGEILTNAHVVEDMSSIIVILSNGEGYEGKVKYIDSDLDLAVVKIEKLGLTVAQFADESSIYPGNQVVAGGTPVSMSLRNSVSAGIISGVNRSTSSDYKLIQTDAAINPGNSGGPLVNLNGEVLGICSSGYVGTGIEGLSFAIPISDVKYAINQFQTYGKVKRPSFGGEFQESAAAKYGLPSNEGLTFSGIVPGGAAANAGIQNGDILISVDGVYVNSKIDWNELSKNYLPGSGAGVQVKRGDSFIDTYITFDEK